MGSYSDGMAGTVPARRAFGRTDVVTNACQSNASWPLTHRRTNGELSIVMAWYEDSTGFHLATRVTPCRADRPQTLLAAFSPKSAGGAA